MRPNGDKSQLFCRHGVDAPWSDGTENSFSVILQYDIHDGEKVIKINDSVSHCTLAAHGPELSEADLKPEIHE